MKEVNNSFEGGLITDTSNLQTPKNIYTYLENGTFITYEGDEVILQSEEGNTFTTSLKENYVALDIKSFGNVAYIISAETEVEIIQNSKEILNQKKSQNKFWLDKGSYTLKLEKTIEVENDIIVKFDSVLNQTTAFDQDNISLNLNITEDNTEVNIERFLSEINIIVELIEDQKNVIGFTGRGEVGTFPSPDYFNANFNPDTNSFTTVLTNKYSPLLNYKGDSGIPLNPSPIGENQENLGEFNSINFNFKIDRELEIIALQKSYDDTINIIFTDNFNKPKLINSRFSNISGNKVDIINRQGIDENIYDETNFNNILNHIINSNTSTNTFFQNQGKGTLPVGYYRYLFKYETTDGNQSSVISQSFKIPVRLGSSISDTIMTTNFENSGKSNNLLIVGADPSYPFIRVYYEYYSITGESEEPPKVYRILNRISNSSNIEFTHFGYETADIVSEEEIIITDANIDTYKTGAEIKGRLIIGNVKQKEIDNFLYVNLAQQIYIETGVKKLSDPIINTDFSEQFPELKNLINEENGLYYNSEIEYENTGYFGGESYCFGISFKIDNGVESLVYPLRGIDNINNDASYVFSDIDFDSTTGENTRGVYRFPSRTTSFEDQDRSILNGSLNKANIFFPKFNFSRVIDQLKEANVTSFRIHRTSRKENVVAQGILFDSMITPKSDRSDFLSNGEFSGGFNANNSKYIPSFGFMIESIHRLEAGLEVVNGGNPERWGVLPSYFSPLNVFIRGEDNSFYLGRKHTFISSDIVVDPSSIRNKIDSSEYFYQEIDSYLFSTSIANAIDEQESGVDPVSYSLFIQTPMSDSSISQVIDKRLKKVNLDFVDVNNSGISSNGFSTLFEGTPQIDHDFGEKLLLSLRYNNYIGVTSLDDDTQTITSPILIKSLFQTFLGRTQRVAYKNWDRRNPYNTSEVGTRNYEKISKTINIYSANGIFSTDTLENLYDFPNEVFYPITQNILLDNETADNVNYPDHLFKSYIETNLSSGGIPFKDYVLILKNNKYTYGNLSTNDSIPVFQGDTFVNPTFRRVYYNSMSRQTLESNIIPNQSELAKINVGYTICFFSESKYNTANQTTNIFDVNEGERSFVPYSARDYKTENNLKYDIKGVGNPWREYRLPESEEFNNGLNSKSVLISNTFDSLSPFTQNNFSTRIYASEVDSNIDFINNYKIFNGVNFKDYSKKLGEIIALRNVNGKLFCVHEYGITQIPVNERIAQTGDSAGEVYFESVQVLNPMENIGYISEKIGSKFMKSVVVSENTMYGVDMERGIIWRIGSNGLELISDFKVNKIIKELQPNFLNEIDYFNKINSYYDFNKNNIIFSFNIKENNYKVSKDSINLLFNEIPMNSWSTFTSWKPNSVFNIRNDLYSLNALNDSNKIYKHYNDSFMTYYDKQEFFIVEFVTTLSSQIHQMLDNFKIIGEHMYPEFIDYETEDENFRQYVKARNEEITVPHSKNPLLNIVNYNAEHREGHTYIETVKDVADTELKIDFNNRKIRGKYFKVKFYYRPTNKKMFIQNIVSIINPSFS